MDDLNEFKLNIHHILPAIINYFSEQIKGDIVIHESLLNTDSLITSADKMNKNIISIEKFLNLLIERWEKEILYQNEIILLKDKIYEEYDKLCTSLKDKKLGDIAKNQAPKIVDKIFEMSNFDDSNLAGKFCQELTKGFENEAFSYFSKVVVYVIWKPHFTPYPINLIEFIKKCFVELLAEPSESKLNESTRKIIKHVRNHFTPALVNLHEIDSDSSFQTILKQLANQRRLCTLLIKKPNEVLAWIKKSKSPYIGNIKVNCSLQDFSKKWELFNFDSLEIPDVVWGKDLRCLFSRIPKSLKFISLEVWQVNEMNIQIMEKMYISFPFLSELILKIKRSFMTNIGFKRFAKMVGQIKGLNILELNFSNLDLNDQNQITDEGFKELALALKNNKNLKKLSLIFQGGLNQISDNGLEVIAGAILSMTSINDLYLSFCYGKHRIYNKGIEAIAKSVKDKKCLTNLILNFGGNKINDKGIECLVLAIKELYSIENLKLNFSGNKVTAIGLQTIDKLKAWNNGINITIW